jgi:hypothetical protein
LKLIKKNQKLLDENGEFEEYIEVTKYNRIDISPPTQMCAKCEVLCFNLVNGVQMQVSQFVHILNQVQMSYISTTL